MLKRSEFLVAFRGRLLKMRETVAGDVTSWLVWGLQASGQLTVNFLVQLVEQRTGGSEQWQSMSLVQFRLKGLFVIFWASQVALVVKNLPANAG